MAKKKALGRGFDSLIPTKINKELDPTAELDEAVSRVTELLIKDIHPNLEQPRSVV